MYFLTLCVDVSDADAGHSSHILFREATREAVTRSEWQRLRHRRCLFGVRLTSDRYHLLIKVQLVLLWHNIAHLTYEESRSPVDNNQ